jgi:hypothetical protein
VLREGHEIVGQLELHLYPNREPGWCLTHKLAWREDEPVGGRRSNPVSGSWASRATCPTRGVGHADAGGHVRAHRARRRPAAAGLCRAAGHRRTRERRRPLDGAARAPHRAALPAHAAPAPGTRVRLDAALALLAASSSVADHRARLRLRRPQRLHAPVQAQHRAEPAGASYRSLGTARAVHRCAALPAGRASLILQQERR